MKYLDYTADKRERLRDAFCEACERGDTEFTFDGVKLQTGYAKYLLDFLDMEPTIH